MEVITQDSTNSWPDLMVPKFSTVATVFFEQQSYTVPMDNNNITLRIFVNGTLATNITLYINIIGMIMGVESSGWLLRHVLLNLNTRLGISIIYRSCDFNTRV